MSRPAGSAWLVPRGHRDRNAWPAIGRAATMCNSLRSRRQTRRGGLLHRKCLQYQDGSAPVRLVANRTCASPTLLIRSVHGEETRGGGRCDQITVRPARGCPANHSQINSEVTRCREERRSPRFWRMRCWKLLSLRMSFRISNLLELQHARR